MEAAIAKGDIIFWLLDGRRLTQRKNVSVGYESKCPGLRQSGMKSLPSVLPRPGHLLSYPTERLFLNTEIRNMNVIITAKTA